MDGIGDVCDNCKHVSNEDQLDENNNMVGDACDNGTDSDNDGVPDSSDNCPNTPNTDLLNVTVMNKVMFVILMLTMMVFPI